jgi:cytochrome c oxidase subunit 2
MGRLAALLPLVALAALSLAGTALADDPLDSNGGFTPRTPASPEAARVMDVYWLLVGLGTFIFLIVVVPLATFAIRYRSRGRGREVEGPQIRGNSRLEVGWTLGAVLLVTVLISFVFYKLPGIVDPAEASRSGDELRVTVEGRQFYWRFVYPNGTISYDTLRLPQGREVTFDVTAPEHDVIHSFWVPNLQGKRDAIPGQTTSFTVLPEQTGEFQVICGELCGLQHAAMRGKVEVVPAGEYDRWADEQEQAQQGASADQGGQMWVAVCSKCHGEGVAGEIGPALEGNPLLADREALARIVRNGRRTMPAVGQGWSDQEIDSLVEFTKNLAGQGGQQGGNSGGQG